MKTPADIRLYIMRIHWRDFVKTRAYAYAQFILKMFRYELVVEFNNANEATDVYVNKRG